MIKIQTLDRIDNIEHIVKPTIFPDGTSQVWKLPEEIINSLNTKVTWSFEAEREIFDLLSLKKLLYKSINIHLHIPFLPFARQDKNVSNETTFNLHILTELLNSANFNLVTAVDVHNPKFCKEWINNFQNVSMSDKIKKLSNEYDVIVFPDYGATRRYSLGNPKRIIEGVKTRNQQTGEITGLKLNENQVPFEPVRIINSNSTCLIIDDICDGGKTFIEVAKALKDINETVKIDLYVTHGIFSKGKQILHDAGIQNIYCTNSLLKNTDGFKV